MPDRTPSLCMYVCSYLPIKLWLLGNIVHAMDSDHSVCLQMVQKVG